MTGLHDVPMLYAVIPAGGSGTRLWPLSRAGNPKFLHPLTGSASTLLQATVERLAPLAPPERTYVVTGVAHATAVARQLPKLPEDHVIVEPSPRDSCAAIGLAAAIIAEEDPHAVMGSFPADHLVGSPEVDGGPIRLVREFKEKPSYEVASGYVQSGHYFWNAGMFVWQVDVFLRELARQQPELHAGLTAIAKAWPTEAREEVLGAVWPSLTKISVDYAVMEGAAGAGLVATVPGAFGWNDVGDFHTLGDALPGDEASNVIVEPGEDAEKADVLLLDSAGVVVVPHSGRLVSVLGMHNVVVVDTPDAVLVCPRERAQDVKRLVDELKGRGDLRLV